MVTAPSFAARSSQPGSRLVNVPSLSPSASHGPVSLSSFPSIRMPTVSIRSADSPRQIAATTSSSPPWDGTVIFAVRLSGQLPPLDPSRRYGGCSPLGSTLGSGIRGTSGAALGLSGAVHLYRPSDQLAMALPPPVSLGLKVTLICRAPSGTG